MESEFKLKVPQFVDTEDQGVWVLFTFIRRCYLHYDIPVKEGLNFYVADVMRILDCESKDINKFLQPHLKDNMVDIGRLFNDRICFWTKGIHRDTVTRELTDPRAIRVWCYLMGCINNNLINEGDKVDRRICLWEMDRKYFAFSDRKYNNK
jgi:hypothetical protein